MFHTPLLRSVEIETVVDIKHLKSVDVDVSVIWIVESEDKVDDLEEKVKIGVSTYFSKKGLSNIRKHETNDYFVVCDSVEDYVETDLDIIKISVKIPCASREYVFARKVTDHETGKTYEYSEKVNLVYQIKSSVTLHKRHLIAESNPVTLWEEYVDGGDETHLQQALLYDKGWDKAVQIKGATIFEARSTVVNPETVMKKIASDRLERSSHYQSFIKLLIFGSMGSCVYISRDYIIRRNIKNKIKTTSLHKSGVRDYLMKDDSNWVIYFWLISFLLIAVITAIVSASYEELGMKIGHSMMALFCEPVFIKWL